MSKNSQALSHMHKIVQEPYEKKKERLMSFYRLLTGLGWILKRKIFKELVHTYHHPFYLRLLNLLKQGAVAGCVVGCPNVGPRFRYTIGAGKLSPLFRFSLSVPTYLIVISYPARKIGWL